MGRQAPMMPKLDSRTWKRFARAKVTVGEGELAS